MEVFHPAFYVKLSKHDNPFGVCFNVETEKQNFNNRLLCKIPSVISTCKKWAGSAGSTDYLQFQVSGSVRLQNNLHMQCVELSFTVFYRQASCCHMKHRWWWICIKTCAQWVRGDNAQCKWPKSLDLTKHRDLTVSYYVPKWRRSNEHYLH